MSKSKKNVIDPDVLLKRYGADTTRFFCLFAAPPERDLEWSEQGVEGGARFLNRVWRLVWNHRDAVASSRAYDGSPDALGGEVRDLYKKTHQTIRKVTRDIEERFHFNTAIAAVMELVNTLYATDLDLQEPQQCRVARHSLESIVLLLSPVVPHFAEELWAELGHPESLLLAPWPAYREDALEQDEILVVVQVNGKLRSRVTLPTDASEDTIRETALADENVRRFIEGKDLRRVIVVKNKLVNIVV
jgi:leucyl-tRNA synthetase